MLAADAPYPPAGYSGVWLWWGILLLGVSAGLVVLARRARRPPPAPSPAPAGPDPATVRQAYLAEVEALRQRHAAGALDDRRLHHELSRVVRAFVAEASGTDARVMTPSDLRRAGQPVAASVVDRFWATQFGPRADQPATDSVEAARRLIGSGGADR